MDPQLNPYNPGSGVTPRVLAGREEDIAAFDTLIVRAKRQMHVRPIVFSGLRGVGKTVLLNRLNGLANHQGFRTIKFEARSGVQGEQTARRALAAGLIGISGPFRARSHVQVVARMLASITSFSASVGLDGVSLGVERDASRASSGLLDMDLQDVIEDVALALRKEQSALVVFIDEMQDLDNDLLEALITVQHHTTQLELPFFIVGAGLPNLPIRLAEARSYAERLFEYRTIGRLDEAAARESLAGPAEQLGQSYDDKALESLLAESGRYPYFIQEFGSAMWKVATVSPFSAENAEAARELGRATLDSGFFPSRWERATPAEKDYMRAMAEDGDVGSSSGDIAHRLEKQPQALTPARASLINKGIIYSPQRGKVAFTVPGMAKFLERQRHRFEE